MRRIILSIAIFFFVFAVAGTGSIFADSPFNDINQKLDTIDIFLFNYG